MLPLIKDLNDISEIEKKSIESYLLEDDTYQLLKKSALEYADRLAIRFLMRGEPDEKSVDISYQNFFFKITQTSNLFHSLGVEGDKCVSYILPSIPQAHYTIWGGEAAGIVNSINPALESNIIAGILNEAASKVLVTIAPSEGYDTWEKIQSILCMVPSVSTILIVDLNQYLLDKTGSLNLETLARVLPEAVNLLDFDQAISLQKADELIFDRLISPSDIAAYFHTGGTTGIPKLAQQTHRNQIANAWLFTATTPTTGHDVYMSGLPLFHVNAVILSGLSAFIKGATIIMLTPSGFRTRGLMANFWKLVEKYAGTTFSCVPTLLSGLLDIPKQDSNIDSLEYIVCGAAPLSVKVFNDFEEYTNTHIIEGYGSTESTCAATLNPMSAPKIGSVGLRMPYQEIKSVIVDENENYIRECDTDEPGILVLRGPCIFPGYKQKEINEHAFLDGNWFNSGDIGRVDADGYIWLTGRAKDLIIRGGHNIDPGVIEDTLIKHPAVTMAAAVGQPDEYAGELPCVYVVIKQEVSEEELLTYAKENIPERAAVPVHLEIIDQIPTTAVGKIFKPALRERAIKRVFDKTLEDAEVKADVRVINTKESGLVAQISSVSDPAEIEELLGKFTVRYQLI